VQHLAFTPNQHSPFKPKRTQAWYDEIKYYSYDGQYTSATGHATQLIWKSSTEVGCGWAPGCQLLVCR